MDGENNGKPYEQMDDLGVPLFLETPIWKDWSIPKQLVGKQEILPLRDVFSTYRPLAERIEELLLQGGNNQKWRVHDPGIATS